MSVVLSSNKLLNSLIIVFSYKSNGFPTDNTVNHKVLLGLNEFQRHENDYNSSRNEYKK